MKNNTYYCAAALMLSALVSCSDSEQTSTDTETVTATEEATPDKGMAGIKDDVSNKNILQIAMGSKDHTTLVAAVKAAQIEHVVSNPGPLTVFAPVNSAFDALPPGTVEDLLKPENISKLRHILYYHAAPETYKDELLTDGRKIYMAEGDYVNIKVDEDGTIYANDAKILASIEASNGVVHVIDKVLLPPEK